jgi:hypothetical protein
VAEGQDGAVPESAVLVPVPEAEAALGHLRRRLDNVGGRRVPAHVTVVFPFVPPGRIDDDVVATLARAVATVPAFDATLPHPAWFDDADVLYVPAEPAGEFRRLVDAVVASFPQHPPYGGAYDEPVPHLTVGARSPVGELRAAVPELAALLPLRTRVDHALLVQGVGDVPWEVRARLPLG